MPDFRLYFIAVLDHTFFWFGIGLAMLELLKPKWPIVKKFVEQTWLVWTLAGVCVFIATFQAWNEEHKNVQRQNTYIKFETETQLWMPSPMASLFQAHQKSAFAVGKENVGEFIAQEHVCKIALEVSDFRSNSSVPLEKIPIPTTADAEAKAFSLMKEDWKDIPANSQTYLPHGHNFIIARTFHELSDDEVNDLLAGKKLLYLVGFTVWTDGSGTHEMQICRWIHPQNPPGQVITEVCTTHNGFLQKAED